MSHEIEMVNGQASMAYAGQVPWHGLGNKVDPNLTPYEIMCKAKANWAVEEVESFIEYKGEKRSTGQKSLVRETDGKILTNVGEGWHPVQNSDAFDFFAEYVEAGDMEMHTAGVLNGGRIVWVLAKVNDSFTLKGGDKVDSYLLFSNPHQYGKSINIRFTPIRVVCWNTLTFALANAAVNQMKISHRSQFNPEMVKDTMGIAKEKFTLYQETAELLSKKRYTQENVVSFYDFVFPRSEKKKQKGPVKGYSDLTTNGKKAYDVLEDQPGADINPGTWWNVFNSVTYMTDHIMGRKTDSRMQSAWFGVNQSRKLKAMEKAIEFAKVA